MKKPAFIILMLSALAICQAKEVAYLEKVKAEGIKIEKESAQTVRVSMVLDFTELNMDPQHSVRFVPSLYSADGKHNTRLSPVVLNGKTRNRIHNRVELLDKVELNPDAQLTLRRENGNRLRINYTDTLKYERWMNGAELRLSSFVTGCASCSEGDETTVIAEGVLPPMVLNLKRRFMYAPYEAQKMREETYTARINFRVGSAVIEPALGNNTEELETVRRSVSAAQDNPYTNIIGIYITGYASPEGGFDSNMRLSERRARAFAQYIALNIKTGYDTRYNVNWHGEDWEGLRKEIEKIHTLEARQEIIDIIDHCRAGRDICEARLRTLKPDYTYPILKNEIYPLLRRNEYRIKYTVRNINEKEGRGVILTHPELMNVYEMQNVADTYTRGSREFMECWLIAIRTYPDNEVAANNAAMLLAENGRMAEAKMMIERFEVKNANMLNLLGTIYASEGDFAKAAVLFSEAAEKGSVEAVGNEYKIKEYMGYYGIKQNNEN